MEEVWKDIPNYEGYRVSNLGKVKSLARKGFNKKDIVLKPSLVNGYFRVTLVKNNIKRNIFIHQLVAMAFLNHTINGYNKVVDHKDENKLNNNLLNLQIISPRENRNRSIDKTKTTSSYTGVSWDSGVKKWRSKIYFKDKQYYLGVFDLEKDAFVAYQEALLRLEQGLIPIMVKYKNKEQGVYYHKTKDKWIVRSSISGKIKYLGTYNTKEEAQKRYNDYIINTF